MTGPFGALRATWRRSLQARVVMSTLLLSSLVVALVGWTLLRQVTDGLVESKLQTSLQDAAGGFAFAQSTLDDADPTDLDPGALLTELLDSFSARGAGGELYQISISGPVTDVDAGPGSSGWRSLGEVDEAASVPPRLWRRVAEEPGNFWSYTRLRYDGAASVPALAVGSQLQMPADGGTYLMFYFFPLQEQQQTLQVVRAALLTAGSLLVLLVGVVAFLVTRQVVTPVRLARRIAERLAAGRLEERMHVRGEDDLARLGTSFNQMAGSLQRQIRQLEDLSRVQRRFVSDVSHELRTPLTTVRMAADVLHEARDRFDDATARSAELLQAELNRFESLLSDLLEISRFDAGVAGLELDEVDLVDVANRVADASRVLAGRRGSTLIVSGPGHPCVAQADVRRIERIVRNLVSNAIDYGEGQPIVITVAASPDAAAIAVRDRGVGLRPEEAALVFNRFWRADPARARTSGGTGLGLAISLEDARLHGGWLQVWGEPGAGTQFRLTLPRRAGDRLDRSPLPLVPSDVSRTDLPVRAAYAEVATAPSSGAPAGQAVQVEAVRSQVRGRMP
ncbi:MAG: MtrAB system histidine kinase MtrB [Actinomycetota bacterium]|nr:MtrAB system histidine kinase MtrB [Actinomycetota bacterium]